VGFFFTNDVIGIVKFVIIASASIHTKYSHVKRFFKFVKIAATLFQQGNTLSLKT